MNIIQIGLGPMGRKMVPFVFERKGLKIVAAVDPAPTIAGQDLGTLCGLKKLGIIVRKDLKTALKGVKAEAAILTTVSSLKVLENQVLEIARAGLHIVSTCEELSFPWKTHSRVARRIDAICKKHNVTCVGTGVNPGFLMDYLPCVLSSVCQKVEAIRVSRIQDASKRRLPFQKKIGAGLTLPEFRKKALEGTLRHVGLTESMHMIASCMKWKLTRTTESLKPVMGGRNKARGVEQIGRGYAGNKEVIKLYFRAAMGEKCSTDRIEILGNPAIVSVIPGGVNGDVATCAIVINALESVSKAGAGLKTMLDLPVPGFCQAFAATRL